MSEKLKNKIAVVTGGNSGIGLATAKRFVDEGAAHVYITGRRQKELDAATKHIGKNVTAVAGDVSKAADLENLYAKVKASHGRVDVIFANAGGGEFVPLADVTDEHFDKWFGINVKGLIYTVSKALPILSDGASVIFNGSIAASLGMEKFGVYNATKAAVRSLARTWAVELKPKKIRVNVVAPGPIKTPAIAGLVGSQDAADAFFEQMAQQIPLGRHGAPEEVAGAVTFLASADASYVNGVELFVDGGLVSV